MRRVAEALGAMFLLVTLTFFLAHAVPGGPAYAILGQRAQSKSVANLNADLGLDIPVREQYAIWWWHLLHLNFGTSFLQHRPVGTILLEYAGNTFAMYGLAIFLALAASMGLGLLHGVQFRSRIGRVCSGIELVLYAMPGFFIATLLSLVFAAWWRMLPAGGMEDLHLASPTLADRARHIVLPASSIALFALPWFSRILAQSVDREVARDYVRTARARGLAPAAILRRHVLPNALRPLVTVLGYSLPAIFSGSVVVESVFGYPGLGWLLWRSAVEHDYPVLVGIVLVVGTVTMLGNFVADVVNSWLDPRASFVG